MPRSFRRWLIALSCIALLGGIAFFPTQMRYGIDYQLYRKQVPLYAKAFHFYRRHYAYRDLVKTITQACPDQQAAVIAVSDWVHEHIKLGVPEGLPVNDDHVWNIIVRGYGTSDQCADVFAVLCVYSGIRATMYKLRGENADIWRVGAVALIDDAWRVFDTDHGLYFYDSDGRLASIEAIQKDPTLVSARARQAGFAPERYTADFTDLRSMPNKVGTLRAENQIPIKRLLHEIKKILRLESDPELFYG